MAGRRALPGDHTQAGRPRSRTVGQWRVAASSAAGLEAPMGTKDKGHKTTKKVAAKDLKQKRLDKKAKGAAAGSKQHKSV